METGFNPLNDEVAKWRCKKSADFYLFHGKGMYMSIQILRFYVISTARDKLDSRWPDSG